MDDLKQPPKSAVVKRRTRRSELGIDLETVPDATEAKKRIRKVIEEGEVIYSDHALKEMKKDRLTTHDCLCVLRAGIVDPPEWEKGKWRFPVRTMHMHFVVELPLNAGLRVEVVTGWRIRK